MNYAKTTIMPCMLEIIIVALLLPMVCLTFADHRKLELFAEWKEMEYKFPSEYERIQALQDGRYMRGNALPTDVDVYYEDKKQTKIFVTVPRFAVGVPVTLGYITEKQGKYGPKLHPYPDYTWHSSNGTDCSGITSVVLIAIDKCNRLWLVDNGRIENYQACQPQILTFDLKTDRLKNRYLIPTSQYTSGKSLMNCIIVDIRKSPEGDCKNTMVYVTDSEAFGLIVYDYSCDESWRVEKKFMQPVPKYENFTVSGESILLKEGILGMTLSPKSLPYEERKLYLRAMASVTEYTIPLKILNNKKNWVSRPDAFSEAFMKIGSRGIQSVGEAMDKNGNIFFGLLTPNAVVCWDSSTPYKRSNFKIIALSKHKLQFPAGIKIITNQHGKEALWVISNRNQKFRTTMRIDEVNFRVFTIELEKVLVGNKCKGPSLE